MQETPQLSLSATLWVAGPGTHMQHKVEQANQKAHISTYAVFLVPVLLCVTLPCLLLCGLELCNASICFTALIKWKAAAPLTLCIDVYIHIYILVHVYISNTRMNMYMLMSMSVCLYLCMYVYIYAYTTVLYVHLCTSIICIKIYVCVFLWSIFEGSCGMLPDFDPPLGQQRATV